MRRAVLAAAAAAFSVAAQASPPPPTGSAPPVSAESPADPARLEKARRLAELTEPFELVVGLNMAGWEAGMAKSLELDPEAAKLERAYPGAIKAGMDSARSLARTHCEEYVRRSIDLKAGVYARRLTARQLDEAIAFWSTDAGKAFVRATYVNMDFRGVGNEAAEVARRTGKSGLPAESLARANREVIRKSAGQITPAQQAALTRFRATATGSQYVAARREAEPLVAQMVDDIVAAQQRSQVELIQKGILAFVEARKRP